MHADLTEARGKLSYRRPPTSMRAWLLLATDRSTVRRALGVAAVVGSVLIVINHGDAILHGDLSPGRLLRMALTVLVPYCVSTYSSVGARRDLERRLVTREEEDVPAH